MLTLATGAVCCWDASPAYESSSTSGSDSYAASPAICPEYISGDRSPHTPAPHALTGFIFLARVHVPHSSRRCRPGGWARRRAPPPCPARSKMRSKHSAASTPRMCRSSSTCSKGRKDGRRTRDPPVPTWAPPPETSADSSRRRLKDATELGDVFELPDAVAAALFHRILAVNSTRPGDDDTSTGDDDVAVSSHAEISLADCVVYLAVCKTKPGAALEEADALFRRGCTLADLAKVAMDDDDDDDDGARGPFLATLSRHLARSATKLTKKFPGLAAAVPTHFSSRPPARTSRPSCAIPEEEEPLPSSRARVRGCWPGRYHPSADASGRECTPATAATEDPSSPSALGSPRRTGLRWCASGHAAGVFSAGTSRWVMTRRCGATGRTSKVTPRASCGALAK